MSVNVYKKENKNLGESTNLIGRTILMQIMMPKSSGANGTTYVKAPSWDNQRVQRWYASITSNFETGTGPSTRSVSQIACRIRGNNFPNWIDSGAIFISVVLLTLGVTLTGWDNRLRISCGRRWA